MKKNMLFILGYCVLSVAFLSARESNMLTSSSTQSATSVSVNKANSQTQNTDKEFKELINRFYTAWSSGNPDNAGPFYAQEPDLVFYDIAPLKYNGWQAYNEGVRKVFESAKFVPNNDLNVVQKGPIAWTSVTFHLSGKRKNGEAVEREGRHTAIWEKRDGKWVVVHEHWSLPML